VRDEAGEQGRTVEHRPEASPLDRVLADHFESLARVHEERFEPSHGPLRAAVRQVFPKRVLVQRCLWHKRENVVSYRPRAEQASGRRRLQRAYDRPTYTEAKAALAALHREPEGRNQSAAASLAEGLEETLTPHRLGVYELLRASFKTTNCLESTNALVEERCAKVDVWKTSHQRHRWLATALLDIEPRPQRVKGHRHLPKLEAALRRALNIREHQTREQKVA
jgi:putative transposase